MLVIEGETDRYSPLPSFAHRTRFLIHVQLPILEQYYSRISSSLDAFETLSSALVRAVPGALGVEGAKTDSRKLTGGVEGSQRLCKALLSARYVESAMQRWGEEEVRRLVFWVLIEAKQPFADSSFWSCGQKLTIGQPYVLGRRCIPHCPTLQIISPARAMPRNALSLRS
jgi:hypothetical protein